jgi:hypothetical protein
MGDTPKNFNNAVKLITKKLKGKQYAFRGTTSVVLQGLDMNVQDIDILADRKTALAANDIFSDYLTDVIKYGESEKFKSFIGRFEIDGVEVEIYGNWRIKDTKGNWSKTFDASGDEILEIEYEGIKVKVTKIETELAMYALMGRWNAYWKLKREWGKSKQGGLF